MKFTMGLLVLAGVFVGAAAACSGDDDTTAPTGTVSAGPPGTPTTPANPIVSDEGIEVSMEPTTKPGWPQVMRTCKADGYVSVRDGLVVSVEGGPSSFKPGAGERVYNRDGTPFVESTLVTEPAYRREDGKLIVSWKECKNQPASGLRCQDDGYVWITAGTVSTVTQQPGGKPAAQGETVYGPDGLPLPDSGLELVPVFRGDDGKLVYGWPQCEDAG